MSGADVPTCAICLAEVAEDACYVLECTHTYHAGCLVGWFRQGNVSCPTCRASATVENLSCYTVEERARFLRATIARRVTAPPELRAMVERLKRCETKLREARRAFRIHEDEHRPVLHKARRLRANVWASRAHVRRALHLLGLYNHPNLTLPALRVRGV